MRRFASAVIAVISVATLASCALLPPFTSDFQKAEVRMEKIADALNTGDAAALKAMFSPYALQQAVDIDERLKYVLSYFPDGGVTWDLSTVSMEGRRDNGKRADLLNAHYTLFANGSEYRLRFSFYPENDFDASKVGILAMGVTPMTDEPPPYGEEWLFGSWAGAIHIDQRDDRVPFGYPGVYRPVYDSALVSDLVMQGIVEELDSLDHVGLEERFAEYAKTTLGSNTRDQIQELFTQFPDGEVTWEGLMEGPLVRRAPGGGGEAVLLLPTYPMSSGGKSYWLSFAVFTMNTLDPTKVGINAVGVAPRTLSGDSPQELALFGWLDSFQVDAGPAPGIFIAE